MKLSLAAILTLTLGSPCLAPETWATSQATPQQTPAQEASTPAPLVPSHLDAPTLFKQRGCEQCHQIHGAGGHKGPDLSGVGRRMPDNAIRQQIIDGGDAMPPYGDAMAPDDITTLVAYLHKQRAKPAKTKPADHAAPKVEPARDPD